MVHYQSKCLLQEVVYHVLSDLPLESLENLQHAEGVHRCVVHLVLPQRPPPPVRQRLLLANLFLQQLLADESEVAVFLFGEDGLEEDASVDDILALSSGDLFLGDSYRKEHAFEIVIDGMPQHWTSTSNVFYEGSLQVGVFAFQSIQDVNSLLKGNLDYRSWL